MRAKSEMLVNCALWILLTTAAWSLFGTTPLLASTLGFALGVGAMGAYVRWRLPAWRKGWEVRAAGRQEEASDVG